jgi:hypothetical protein
MSQERFEYVALGEHVLGSFRRWWIASHVVVDTGSAVRLSVGGWACNDTRLEAVFRCLATGEVECTL